MTKHQSIPLFKNAFFEKFSHVHPITPLVAWGPVVGWFIWRAFTEHHLDAWSVVALLVSGAFFWTFFEYFLHRVVFHYDAKSAIGKRFIYLFHGIHHDDPQDPTRLVMPPIVSLTLGWAIYFAFRGLLGLDITIPFFAGFMTGYLCYDYTHFAVHHFTPKTPIGKFLKQYHMVHHYVSPDSRWGVSSPLWDYILGTAEPRPKATQSSP